MIWLLHDLDLLSVLARAAILAFEALLLGGVAYLWVVIVPARAGAAVASSCRRGIRAAALAMALSELAGLAISSADLLGGGAGLGIKDLVTTQFFLAASFAAGISLLLWFCARAESARAKVAMIPLGLLLLTCAVSASHSVSRIDHRVLLAILTAAHHLGTAAWVGAMPFMLVSLKRSATVEEARSLVRRYTQMAVVAAAVLILAGIAMAWFYVASWNGLYGTSYGVLLMAKIYLLLVMLGLGSANWLIVRRLDSDPEPLLKTLRRFAEAEIGLGFTAVLAAASLTAQPPAVDVSAVDLLTPHELYARMHPILPRMKSPPVNALTPATSLEEAIHASQFQVSAGSDATDRAWSEYNHHWAGVVVVLAGVLAWLSRIRGMGWARFWPLSFAGLSVFILLRADPENWPLGPRPFWQSFASPDVLSHRAAALLILCFAVFECAVQAGKLHARWASAIFPTMCILGAVILLTHSHSAPDAKEELLAGMNHESIALLGATAGWGRWLELRLPKGRAAKVAGYLWPLFLVAAGLVLLNYRES